MSNERKHSKLDELIRELCPDGVEYLKFSDTCKYIRGITYNKEQEAKPDDIKPWKVLRANNITLFSNTLNFDDVKLVKKEVRVKPEQMLIKGDILICAGSGSKEHVGKVAYITDDLGYTYGGFMAVIRCNKELNSRFLFHILTGVEFSNYLKVALNSTTINNLNSSIMAHFSFPVPPLPIQREIVRILDKFTELTAALIAELTAELAARKKQYGCYRDSLLSFAGNTDVKNVPLGDIAKFVYGYTDKAKETGSVRFVRITDISEDGKLNPYDAKYVELTEESKKYLLEKGDLLLARTGATYGKTLYFEADEPAVYASFLIKIILDNSVIKNRYYWHFSKSSLYWEQAERYVSKGGQQQFNTNAVSRVKVPVPSLEVQDKIIYVLDNFDAICSDLNIVLPAEIETRKKQYEFYRDALLTYAATGIIIATDRQTDRHLRV